MRYREIVEAESDAGATAREVWKQTQKKHEALRTLRSKERAAHASTLTAQAMKPGPERAAKLASANDRLADGRRQHGVKMAATTDAIRNALSRD